MKKNLEQYWAATYAKTIFEPATPGHFIRQKIEQFIPPANNGRAIEIGCYPGTYLSVFGDLGYELSGLDTYNGVLNMGEILKDHGYYTGSFTQVDFDNDNWQSTRVYEVVSSFGFIEHFENYEQIIRKHINLLSDNGYIVIGAPNFLYGIQYWFHFLFDTPNLRRHVLKAMKPGKWKDILEQEDVEIIYCDYCGGIQLWMNHDQSALQRLGGKFVLKFFKLLRVLFSKINFENINYKRLSCYFLVIGRRKMPGK